MSEETKKPKLTPHLKRLSEMEPTADNCLNLLLEIKENQAREREEEHEPKVLQ